MIDFIGIGAQKSGTSWAYTCLYEHPEICAPIKEIHFFSRPRFEQGKDWYESHFKSCGAKIKGEFSTSYLYSTEAPSRIHSLYPHVKLIAILRNPASRAISQYKNAIKAGEITESISFEAFLAQEDSVINQGKYFEQLERYLAVFPKEQLLVLIYEDIAKDPKAFMERIYRFLGVSDTFEASMLNSQVNIARIPKSVSVGRVMHHTAEYLRKVGFDKLVHAVRKTGVPDYIHALNTKKVQVAQDIDTKELAPHFVADTQKLSSLLGRDLCSEWNIC